MTSNTFSIHLSATISPTPWIGPLSQSVQKNLYSAIQSPEDSISLNVFLRLYSQFHLPVSSLSRSQRNKPSFHIPLPTHTALNIAALGPNHKREPCQPRLRLSLYKTFIHELHNIDVGAVLLQLKKPLQFTQGTFRWHAFADATHPLG